MLESEFQKWHDKQVKREAALEEVENRVNSSHMAIAIVQYQFTISALKS